MTIKEFATSTGITPSAVYKRLKQNGLKVADLTELGSPELTPEGLGKLKAIFVSTQVENRVEKTAQVISKLTDEVESLKKEITTLRAQVDALTGERDFLRQTLERQQQLTVITMARLPEPDSRSFFQRLFGKKKSQVPDQGSGS